MDGIGDAEAQSVGSKAGNGPRASVDYEHVCADRPRAGAAIRNVLDRIGDKWSLLVIVALENGPLRHGQLKRQVAGVSQRMLTLTLRQLERDGLVTRSIFAQIPPRVDYELTELGRTLIPPAQGIALWAIEHFAAIERSRARFDLAEDITRPSDM